jgi:high affinity Mn2+ porin
LRKIIYRPQLILKTSLALMAILLFSLRLSAQGDDADNTYKGLLSNQIDSLGKWSSHFQFTSIEQGHPSFHSVYAGQNSLHSVSEKNLSATATLYLGRKLWKGASLFLDAEIAGGGGVSSALGLAGAANGETFRIGNPAPALYMARGFFEQIIPLRKSSFESRRGEKNQLAENISPSRITITAGKFSLADFFDDNAYSHDPRSEFMNWALMDNGAWDYPANTRGYTWGVVAELTEPGYAIRLSSVLVPKIANSEVFDPSIAKANGETAEFEKKFKIKSLPGNLRILGYMNFTRAPGYTSATSELKEGDSTLARVVNGKTAGTQYGGLKYGIGISFNQQLSRKIGIFSRAGWNDGKTATWAFTEIDRTISAGLRIIPNLSKRPGDHLGIAVLVNGISNAHRDYLNSGGYGFIIGDGKLTHYGYEQIMESYYKVKLSSSIWITADYQFVLNPAYNKDRGPVHIFALRTHVEF